MTNLSRRGFLSSVSVGLGSTLGAAALGASSRGVGPTASDPARRLPREVWIASITQNKLEAENHEQMTEMLIKRMQELVPLNPDIICLPELGPFANLSSGRPEVGEIADKLAGPVVERFAEFARTHGCYLWCPTYTAENGRYYNALLLIDRQGKVAGEYRKMHPTAGECDKGISPGPQAAPVFQTDFGKIGAALKNSGRRLFGEMVNQQTAWLKVPAVQTVGTGHIRTAIPRGTLSLLAYIPVAPKLIKYLPQANNLHLECDFVQGCKIVDGRGEVQAELEQAHGETFTIAEVTLPDTKPQPTGPQPQTLLPNIAYLSSDLLLPFLMRPVYRRGKQHRLRSIKI